MQGVEHSTLDEWAATITYRVCEALFGAGGLLPVDERYQALYKQVWHGVRLAQEEAREELLEGQRKPKR